MVIEAKLKVLLSFLCIVGIFPHYPSISKVIYNLCGFSLILHTFWTLYRISFVIAKSKSKKVSAWPYLRPLKQLRIPFVF